MVIDQGERGAMVIDRGGKPMLWVKVADPPCILIIQGPATEKGRIFVHLEQKSSEALCVAARAVLGQSCNGGNPSG